ncbi:hypothetical protein [Pedobacter terrae]|uniref:hypothetical protein n=1 Tax=Pedobacter terrae TaxID=405671 RepID=UPI002FF830E9
MKTHLKYLLKSLKTAFRAKQQGNANLFPTSVLSASGSFKAEGWKVGRWRGNLQPFTFLPFTLKWV